MADIAKGVRSFAVGTGLSRILGLVREQVFAYLFGVGLSSDAFNAAFRIPNLFRDLFAENALSNAFVPVLTAARAKGKDEENRFASNILNTLLLTVGLITILGMLFAPGLARLVGMGFQGIPGKTALTARLTFIMFPFLLFIVLAAWAMSYLNTENEFFVPAFAPAFFNAFSIAIPIALFGYYFNRGKDPILGMAIGVMVGGLVQFLVQVPRLFRRGFVYRRCLNFRDAAFRKAMSLFFPVAIGLSASRINVLVNTMLISSIPGGISWLNYAYRIFHLPLGMLGYSVGQVSLPVFSRLVNENRFDDLRRSLSDSLRLVLFLTIPTSLLIAVLARPITGVIYEHGVFTAADTRATAAMLILYMIGVPFVSALRNVASVFYACQDARWPMVASFISVGSNIVLNLALMRILGPRAFPLSASVAAIVNIGILFVLLPKKIGSFPAGPLFRFTGILTLASSVGAGAAWAGSTAITRFAGSSFFVQLGSVIVCGLAGLGIFCAACLLLGLTEARDFARRLLRRSSREDSIPPSFGDSAE
ncbi:MAG: murein biosynthesis integral membrane protein MurJ [Candidatus Aminicenantes bacterium]|nr:murein biosynthesis integral membrane protein MurJ [Candidatus Aminicenantes bacterium]